jgi:acetolactate synthase-1/2/3 large subunit
MDGGSRIAEVLKRNGVEFIFTLVGGHISPILVQCKRAGIRVIDTRHEVNTVFAADAVARISGIPGVAAVTAGPGVTNTITAVKNAQMAQSPLVLIGGATATLLRGRGSLQDIDQMSLIEPHVKWAARPNTLREVVPALERAFIECQIGVPGPVFVEIAVDLLYPESVVREWYAKKTEKPNKTIAEHAMSAYIKGHLKHQFAFSEGQDIARAEPVVPMAATSSQIKKAAKMVAGAERPVMVLGSQTMLRPKKIEALVAAVESLNIPVFLSGMARGLLGKGHALQMRHKRRNALKEADIVILSGVPNDFRLDYGAHVSRCKVISVNLSEDDLNKNRRPNLGVLGDPCEFLVELAAAIRGPAKNRDAWFETLRGRNDERDREILAMADEATDYVNPMQLCQGIEEHLSDNSVLVGDGGDFVATASYIVSPRGPYSWLDPGVFGTLGVGAGFALGAKLVRPDADVWLLYGDGAAGFSIMEYDTFARHGVPVISVVGNDAGWTQIERDQVVILQDDVACRLTYMDYHTVAEGCGARGLLMTKPGEIGSVLKKALEISRAGTPVLVNALIGKTDFRKGSISM